jgi:hypothetical protein
MKPVFGRRSSLSSCLSGRIGFAGLFWSCCFGVTRLLRANTSAHKAGDDEDSRNNSNKNESPASGSGWM